MTMKKIEDCNLAILQFKLQLEGYDFSKEKKYECIKQLKKLKVLLINTDVIAKKMKNTSKKNEGKPPQLMQSSTYAGTCTNKDNFVHHSKSYSGEVHNHNKREIIGEKCANIDIGENEEIKKRQYIPVSSANDSLVSNQLVLGSLDVYHDIFFGKYKLRLEDELQKLKVLINDTKYIDTEIPMYIPDVSFFSLNEDANIDYGNIHFSCMTQPMNKLIKFNIEIPFFDIYLESHQFKLNLPFTSNTDYLTHKSLQIDYDYIDEKYKTFSTISDVQMNNSELIINSGLFQMFSNTSYRDFFLNSSKFNIGLSVEYFTNDCI